MISFREYVLLRLAQRLQGDRTIRGIYHILTGKKSAQTIQDVKWYRLTAYYRMFPDWSLPSFEKAVALLMREAYIEKEAMISVTSRGEAYLTQCENHYELPPHFNGWKYGEVAPVFWKRLSLFIQSLSYAEKGERHFRPVITDWETQTWVKKMWPKVEKERKQWGHRLYDELYHCLQQLPSLDASIFTFRLSGYQQTGRTFQQLAETYEIDCEEVYVRFHAVLHYLLKEREKCPSLSIFAQDLMKEERLTKTAAMTKKWLERGYSIPDIARKRRLKKSTIEDHLVEIASEMTDFPVEKYVREEERKAIVQTVKQENTYRLKKIKQALSKDGYEDISYFAIRLTLAYYGGSNGTT